MGYMTYGSSASSPGSSGAGAAFANRYVRGVMGANDSLRIDDIKDGASNTILIGEIRAGVTQFDTRGIWAMGVPAQRPVGPRLHHRRQWT